VDVATGKPIQMAKPLPREHQFSSQMFSSPDGQTLLFSTGRGLLVWDLKNGIEVRTLAGVYGYMVLSHDGKTVITNSGILQRWDLTTGKALFVDNFDKGHCEEIVSLVYSADGKRLASCADDGSVRLWDTTSAEPIHVWRGHERRQSVGIMSIGSNARGANALDMTPDGRWLASCGDGDVKVWDAIGGKSGPVIKLPRPGSNEMDQAGIRLHIEPGGKKLVGVFGAMAVAPPPVGKTLEHNHWLATWDLPSGTMLSEVAIDTTNAASSSIARDGTWLLNNDALVNTVTGKTKSRLEAASYSRLGAPCAISSDGFLIARGGDPEQKVGSFPDVLIWEAATGKKIATLKTNSSAALVAFRPDSRMVAVADRDGIQVWDTVTAKQIAVRKMPAEVPMAQRCCVSSMVFAPDGLHLATGHPDGMIFIWNLDLPAAKPAPPAPQEIEPLWAYLNDTDAALAWRAVWRLADAPAEALALLRKNVKRFVGASPETTDPLLADLDSDVFAKRESANKRLQDLGILAEPALRARLKAKPSLELRRRIEPLLEAIAEVTPPLTREVVRDLRAVAVLARIHSPQARQILEELARGADSAPVTVAAKAALGP
jgi:WD40 repeat protein